jgi:hypothetical protein
VKTSSSAKRATSESAHGLSVALTLLTLAALSALAGCGGAARPAPLASPAATLAASPPFDFAFDSLDERPVSAIATRGEPTLIAFVTTSSMPSQAQVDFLVAMAKHDADRVHYAVVALEPRENRELVEMYVRALAIPFPVALADGATIAGQGPFGDVQSVPSTVLLDREGRVVWRATGRVAKSGEIRGVMRGM